MPQDSRVCCSRCTGGGGELRGRPRRSNRVGPLRCPAACRNTPVSWSRTVRSRCPVTTGVSAASHAAASTLRPGQVHRSGYLRGGGAGAVLQPASSPEAPGWPRSSARSTCTVGWAGWLSGPGSIPESISRWRASSSASCCRWSRVRVSSRAAAGPQRGQHRGHRGGGRAGQVPERRAPAPPMVVSSHTGGHQTGPVGIGGVAGPLDHLLGQRPQIRQPGPAAGGGQRDSGPRRRGGLRAADRSTHRSCGTELLQAARRRVRRRSANARPAARPISPPR